MANARRSADCAAFGIEPPGPTRLVPLVPTSRVRAGDRPGLACKEKPCFHPRRPSPSPAQVAGSGPTRESGMPGAHRWRAAGGVSRARLRPNASDSTPRLLAHRAARGLLSSQGRRRDDEGAPHHRTPHQRAHSGPRGALGRAQRRAGRHRARRGRAASGRRGRPRPRRGRTDGQAASRQAHGLRQVQVRASHEGSRGPQEPGQHGHQGDQAPPQDRPPRLRHQEGPRGAVPQGRGQGQGDDHVPRAGAVPTGAGLPAVAAPRRGRHRTRLRRVRSQAGRAQHDHGPRADEEEVRGQGRGASGEGDRCPQRRGGRHLDRRRRDRIPAGVGRHGHQPGDGTGQPSPCRGSGEPGR